MEKQQYIDKDDDFPTLGIDQGSKKTRQKQTQNQKINQQFQQQRPQTQQSQINNENNYKRNNQQKKNNYKQFKNNDNQTEKPNDKYYKNDKQSQNQQKNQMNDNNQKQTYQQRPQTSKYQERQNHGQQYRNNNQDRDWLVLMVAEKNSIAKTIAESLCDNNGIKQRRGKSKYCPVYEFNSRLFKRKAHFRLTSVAGHVFTTDFPQYCQNWEKIDPLALFDEKTLKKEQNPDSKLVDHLIQEAKNIDCLVLWLDNDREGENICFEVLSIVEKYMQDPNNVYRAKFSSVTHPDIRMAFNSLDQGPNENESLAVDARQIIDLKIGVPFSRFQTMYFQKKYADLKDKLITYGPCQTPTLGFCVQRLEEINNFKPKTFYKLITKIASKNNKTMIALEMQQSQTFNQGEAMQIKNNIESKREVQVTDIHFKDAFIARPEGLNTVNMLKIASNNLGMGPQQTMHTAEHLYLNGFITYPRTESTSYPKTFEFGAVISALKKYQKQDNNFIAEYSSIIEKEGICKPRVGHDAGDHPPITPTNKIPFNLNPDENKLYEYIVKHYLASISQDAKYEKKQITFISVGKSQQLEFKLQGTIMKNLGFTRIMYWQRINDLLLSQDYKKGEKYQIATVEIKAGVTSPPDYLTESELIGLMEKNCIGTDASMATHINNISERNYVKIDQKNGRKLVPTDLGKALISGIKSIDPELVQPQLRAKIEKCIDQIATGQKTKDSILQDVLGIFKEKFKNFVDKFQQVDKFFGKQFGTTEASLEQAKPFSKCGECKKFMKYMIKHSKLYCENCKKEYLLPQDGSKKIVGDKMCFLDKFQIILFNPSNPELPSYNICPKCYNHNPYKEDKQYDLEDVEKLACYLCPSIECQYSSINNSLGQCKMCKIGKLILDPPQSNKYSVSCNECINHYKIDTKIQTIKRLNEKCQNCSMNYKGQQQQESKLCIFCDQDFKSNVIQKLLSEIKTKKKYKKNYHSHKGKQNFHKQNRNN